MEQSEMQWRVTVRPLARGYELALDAANPDAETTGDAVVEVLNDALLRFFNT